MKILNNTTKPANKITMTDRIASFAGDIRFVYMHAALFAVWLIVNIVMGDNAFDPYPFTFLTLVVSLEAIFLATFVLINQNKDFKRTERRANLDLEVDRRSEREINNLKQEIIKLHNLLQKHILKK